MGNPNSPDDPVLSAFMIVGAIATIAVCWGSLILGAVRKTESTEVFEQGLKRQVLALMTDRMSWQAKTFGPDDCLTFLSTNPASEEEGIYVKVKDGPASSGFHPHADREHTPPEFAKWLVNLARRCRKLPLRSSSQAAQTRPPIPTR